MSTKRKAAKSPSPAEMEEVQSRSERYAHLALWPEMNAAAVTQSFNVHGIEPDIFKMMEVLGKGAKNVSAGDMKLVEAMLFSQASALDSMFASMARRAKAQDHLPQFEAHMKFALRAQSQCRATLETLAAIKNPPNVAFVKQANIAHGPQQVNNGQAQPVARAEEKQNPPNELLGNDHGQRLDTGTTGTAGAGDPVMATVGTLDGATHGAGKGRSEP